MTSSGDTPKHREAAQLAKGDTPKNWVTPEPGMQRPDPKIIGRDADEALPPDPIPWGISYSEFRFNKGFRFTSQWFGHVDGRVVHLAAGKIIDSDPPEGVVVIRKVGREIHDLNEEMRRRDWSSRTITVRKSHRSLKILYVNEEQGIARLQDEAGKLVEFNLRAEAYSFTATTE